MDRAQHDGGAHSLVEVLGRLPEPFEVLRGPEDLRHRDALDETRERLDPGGRGPGW